MDAAGMKAFAAEFDPQPFPVDETAARQSFFTGGPRVGGTQPEPR